MRKSSVLCVGLVLGSASAFGQTVFVAKTGPPPSPTPGQAITATAGETLTLEAWVQGIPTGTKLKEFRATMPCSATLGAGASGSINYSADLTPIVYDGYDGTTLDPDYVFAGVARATYGQSPGKCPLSELGGYPWALRGVLTGNAVGPFPVAKYMATFTYNVSTNAEGTFTLQAQTDASTCPAAFGSYLLRNIASPPTCFLTTYTPALTINVPTPGRCCKKGGCTLPACSDGVTRYTCEHDIVGVFTPFATCGGSPTCPCQTRSQCSDGKVCTADTCSNGTCSNAGINVRFADLYPCGGDGIINALDITYAVNAFKGLPDCPVCNGVPCSAAAAETAAAAADGPVTESASTSSSARITLSTDKAVGERGKLFQVDVYASDVVNLRSYHIGVEATGGRSGQLDLESVSVDRQRPDYVFAGQESFMVLVDKTRKTLDVIGFDGEVTAAGPVYLGTFAFRPSAEARGQFQVELQPQDGMTLMMSRNKAVPQRSTGAAILIR